LIREKDDSTQNHQGNLLSVLKLLSSSKFHL
jgi:hypothetical protein